MHKRFYWPGLLLVLLLGSSASACVSDVPLDAALPTSTPVAITPTTAPTFPAQTTDLPVKPQKGFLAPDFTLPNIDGGQVTLGDLRGKIVLVNFWATWCPPCRAEFPVIQQAYQNSDDLVVLAVNLQESAEVVRPFIQEQSVTFFVLLDEQGQVTSTYQARGLPTSFFLNSEGIISAVHIGELSADQLNNYLAQVRGG